MTIYLQLISSAAQTLWTHASALSQNPTFAQNLATPGPRYAELLSSLMFPGSVFIFFTKIKSSSLIVDKLVLIPIQFIYEPI